MSEIERAQDAARRCGMFLTPPREGGTLAQVHCPRCGWGRHIGFDVVVSKYVVEPYGCPACRSEAVR